jgi:hypothetical protein
MKDDYYLKVLETNLAKAELKLLTLKAEAEQIKNQWGENNFRYIMALERVSISSEYIADQKYFLEHGVSRSPIQSVALPPDILEKL